MYGALMAKTPRTLTPCYRCGGPKEESRRGTKLCLACYADYQRRQAPSPCTRCGEPSLRGSRKLCSACATEHDALAQGAPCGKCGGPKERDRKSKRLCLACYGVYIEARRARNGTPGGNAELLAKHAAAPEGHRYCKRKDHYPPISEFKLRPNGRVDGSYCTPCAEEYARSWRYLRTYGITLEEYEAILAHQDGKCAICGKPPRTAKTHKGKAQPLASKRLAIDHDHKTGAVRGVLCWHCNHRLLGVSQDPEVFRQAARYLEHPPADTALLAV